MDMIRPPSSEGNRLVRGLDYLRFVGQKTWYSDKMRFLIIFMMMLCVINFMLIYFGCMNISSSIILGNDPNRPDRPSTLSRIASSVGNGIYLSTTQLTTMGYGDVTPTNTIGKTCVSIVHLVIAFIAFNLAVEYGASNTQTDMITSAVTAAIHPDHHRRRLDIGDDLRNSIAGVVMSEPPKTFEDVAKVAERVEDRGSLIKTSMMPRVQRARDAVNQRKNAALVVPVSEPLTQELPPPPPMAGEFTDLNMQPESLEDNGLSLLS